MPRIVLISCLLLGGFTVARGQPASFLDKSLPRWEGELGSKNAQVRRSAAFALGRMGTEALFAVPSLLRTLYDPYAEVRESAAFALGEIGPAATEQSYTALVKLLGSDSDAHVRRSSAFALATGAQHAAACGEALRKALRDPAAEVRQNAAWALGRLGPNLKETAVADLCGCLADKDSLVRRDAAAALGETGHSAHDALPLLLQRFEDTKEDAVVRQTALSAVVNVVGPDDRKAAAHLIAVLKDADPENERAAALALGNIGGPEAADAVPLLRAAVRDEDPRARVLATAALANIGAEASPAVPELRRALGDADVTVRRNAALALAHIGPAAKEAAYELAMILDPKQADEVRLYAAEALAHIGPAVEKAIPRLLIVLNEDDNPRVRQRAVWALGQVGDLEGHGIVTALEALLSETAPDALAVRYEAARFLALRLGPRTPDRAVEVLESMLNDQTLKVYTRTEAKVNRTGVEGGGGQTTVTANLTGDGRCLAAEALAGVGPKLRRRPALVKSLKELTDVSDQRTRQAAREALRQIGAEK